MISEFLQLTGIGLIIYVFFKWTSRNDDYFVKRGIKNTKNGIFLGDNSVFKMFKYTAQEYNWKMYNAFPEEKCDPLMT